VFRGVSEEYIRQFCAEHKVLVRDRKSGRVWEEWKKKSAGAPNHYWDAEVYAAAAADMLRVSSLREEGQSIPYVPKKTDEDLRSGAWLRTTRRCRFRDWDTLRANAVSREFDLTHPYRGRGVQGSNPSH